MKTFSRLACVGAAILGCATLLSDPAMAQRRTVSPPQAQVSTQAMLPDFVAIFRPPATIVEQYSEDRPCTAHTHTRTAYIQVGRRNGTFPNPTAMLYRDGQLIESWIVTVPPGTTPVDIGSFTWTMNHECPGGTTSVSQAPAPNYRLVVDPGNNVTEHSESNNVVLFHIDPAVTLVRLP
jgi:hypothetical protein